MYILSYNIVQIKCNISFVSHIKKIIQVLLDRQEGLLMEVRNVFQNFHVLVVIGGRNNEAGFDSICSIR